MGFFSATDNFSHSTTIKGSFTKEQALSILQDHGFFLSQDSLAVSIQQVEKPINKNDNSSQPSQSQQASKFYEQTYTVPGILARLLPGMAQTTNHWRMTNTPDGFAAHMTGALDVSVDRELSLTREASPEEEEEAGWVLVDSGTIQCSKFMLGPMKKRLEDQWRDVHRAYVDKMGGEVGTQA